MKTKILLLVAVAMFTINTTATFGQAPKTDRQTVQNPASNNNQHEPRHKKKRSLFPLLNQGHSKSFRAPQATALLLDSAVTQINPAVLEEGDSEKEKTVFTYNAAGNEILHVTYEWDATAQAWKEVLRFGYDDNGNRILEIDLYTGLRWDEKTEQYIEEDMGYKREYAYDHLSWLTLDISYNWENGQFVNNSKTVHEYTDQAGRYIGISTYYRWVNGAWEIESKEEYTRAGQRQFGEGGPLAGENSFYSFPSLPSEDKDGNVLAHARYSYENGNISGGSKIEYTKDANGNITLETYYSWNITTNQWEESGKRQIEYAYNLAGYLTAKTYREWDYEAGAWEEPEIYTYTYELDSKNNVLSFTTEYIKVDFTYDAQNRAVTADEYRWREYYDENIGEFVSRLEKVYSYECDFDSYENLILSSRSEWRDGIVRYHYKGEYAYDANGRRTMYSHLYGSYNNEEEKILYQGDKVEYAYDAKGNTILEIDYDSYDSDAQTFIPYYKSERTYGDRKVAGMFEGYNDAGYVPLTVKGSLWNEESNGWVADGEYKYEWQFDPTTGNPITMNGSQKEGDGPWVFAGTITFYYSPHTVSGIADVPATVAPRVWISNGAVHVENGDASAIQLFDISGRPVANGHLSPGVYLVRVNGKTVKVVTSNK